MPELRPMQDTDLADVLSIIEEFDEEDAAAAEAELSEGVEDHFVFELDDEVIGVSGYHHVPATERTSWLSWTYLREAHRGKGLGKQMLTLTLDGLQARGCRKVFVKVSDYMDPEDGAVYLPALKAYESMGFKTELYSPDYYDAGENLTILGRVLAPEELAGIRPEIREEKPVIAFRSVFEIGDTDGAYTFEWYAESKLTGIGKTSFTERDLQLGLETAAGEGARKVFLTFPSNLPAIHRPLEAAGFTKVGQLADYYENGLDELHFVHNLA